MISDIYARDELSVPPLTGVAKASCMYTVCMYHRSILCFRISLPVTLTEHATEMFRDLKIVPLSSTSGKIFQPSGSCSGPSIGSPSAYACWRRVDGSPGMVTGTYVRRASKLYSVLHINRQDTLRDEVVYTHAFFRKETTPFDTDAQIILNLGLGSFSPDVRWKRFVSTDIQLFHNLRRWVDLPFYR